jgi:transposase
MLTWPASVRVFVSVLPTDMRRSFDTLAAMVREILKQDPLSGHLFVFFNRPRDRAKILLWDRTGYWLFYRRLESGVFRLPAVSGSHVEMTAAELSLILEGIDLSQAERRRRFTLAQRTG